MKRWFTASVSVLLAFTLAMLISSSAQYASEIELPARERPEDFLPAELIAAQAESPVPIAPVESLADALPERDLFATRARPTVAAWATATTAPFAIAPTATNTLNLVLLGSDRRPGSSDWRTDTIIIVAIDVKSRQAGVISVPRDWWVPIPHHAPDRVNTLDFYGGPALVKQVLGANLGIPIDYYVRIDFSGFQQAVDSIGGITVDVECPLTEGYPDPSVPGGIRRVTIPAGKVPMNGQLALDFSRSRTNSSDFERMRRQGRVLLAIREKIFSPEILSRIPELWTVLSALIQTDVPARNILPLVKLGSEMKPSDVHGVLIDHTMTRQTYSPQGYWILNADQGKVQGAAKNLFNGPSLSEAVRRPWPCG